MLKNKTSKALWLGTWVLGGEHFGKQSLQDSKDVIHYAFDHHIRSFDTALFYARGKSVSLLSDICKHHRPQVFISSKGGLKWDGNAVFHDGSPAGLRQDLFKTLELLQTDYLDCYSLHWPDMAVPISESISALQDFQHEGLIKQWGICNFNEKEIDEYLSDYENIYHQVHHNLLVNQSSILKAGHQNKRLINMVYSPLEQGFLTSRHPSWVSSLGKKDVRRRNPLLKKQGLTDMILQLQSEANKKGYSLEAYAFDSLLDDPLVDGIILGCRSIDQLASLSSL